MCPESKFEVALALHQLSNNKKPPKSLKRRIVTLIGRSKSKIQIAIEI